MLGLWRHVQGRRGDLQSIKAHSTAADVNTTITAPSDAAIIRP